MADIEQIRTLAGLKWSDRKIARTLGCDRGTVAKYRKSAPVTPDGDDRSSPSEQEAKPATQVIAGNPTSTVAENPAAHAGSRSKCAPYHNAIIELLEKGLTADRIYRELKEDHQYQNSYSAVVRYVRKLKAAEPKRIWRMECEPGQEAQVDFGMCRTLRTPEGRMRQTNVLRVTLSHSRKGYTETVPRQDTECFIRAIENAFRHFGGTPVTVRIDNLKAGVKKPDHYDPELNPKLADFANHYGTTIIPTRPYTPEHKGKVESDVSYVKTSALNGREFASIEEQNAHLREWEKTVADNRIHGTTRRQVISHFLQSEKDALLPLPVDLFPAYQESTRKVHKDSYVEVQQSYYETPVEYIGRQVWVRWDSKMVHIYDASMNKLVSHTRLDPGKYSSCLGVRGLRIGEPAATAKYWIGRAAILGAATESWAQAVAINRPDPAIRVIQGLLSLSKDDRHLARHIDQACRTALSAGEYSLQRVRYYLKQIENDPDSLLEQEQFAFIQDHPIIRQLSEYSDLLPPVPAPDQSPLNEKSSPTSEPN